MDVIRLSIPIFFALIGVELIVARARRRALYRLSDSISDLSCGILSQLTGIFLVVGTVAAYGWVSRHWALQRLVAAPAWGTSPIAWVGAFLLDDLAYYWMHRVSHEVNLLWAGHVVHHSSEEFNLTVALRQSSLHGLMSWVFYVPLAVLGVPVTMWLVCHGINLVYQFLVHTREVKKLGPLEWVLNTPSHHRVHHGVNPEYQDRNYAGVLIIWDRLFGSFVPEGAEPVYGITKPLASWNPLWANLHGFGEIGKHLRASRTWGDRLRAVFGHPGWRPAVLGPPIVPHPVSAAEFQRYEPPVAEGLKLYALAQFAVVLVASVALLDAAPRLPLGQNLAGMFYIALSLGNIGGILEARSWAGVSELVRLVVLGGAAALLFLSSTGPTGLLAAAAAFAAGSLVWVLRLRPLLTSSDVRAVLLM